ncbi:hypothetical protein CEXT_661491 [Caerostris extrusa]|uniref:Uncharacterized protein n=1 Tax=Caerostris extrusa TaxID=172846 RepID=A0AAV4PT78_CAEEX|nr:hypothetical protein CEXT_661491 [Caerostris extrusa]
MLRNPREQMKAAWKFVLSTHKYDPLPVYLTTLSQQTLSLSGHLHPISRLPNSLASINTQNWSSLDDQWSSVYSETLSAEACQVGEESSVHMGDFFRVKSFLYGIWYWEKSLHGPCVIIIAALYILFDPQSQVQKDSFLVTVYE